MKPLSISMGVFLCGFGIILSRGLHIDPEISLNYQQKIGKEVSYKQEKNTSQKDKFCLKII